MNTLLNNLRNTTCIFNNLMKNNSVYFARGFKTDLKIKWRKPAKLSSISPEKSGDGGLNLSIKSDDYLHKYGESKELQSASDIVKKMFTLEYNTIRETKIACREMTMDLVKRHTCDRLSIEASLGHMTNEILYLQKYMEEHPRNRRTKHFLKELIEKRKKYLTKLRKWDYKRFEYILEKLNLTYKPNIIDVDQNRIERKKSFRILTEQHCDNIVKQRLDKYKVELENEKKSFYSDKAKQLEFVRAEEIACGVTPTVTEEDIIAAREKAAEYQ